MIDPTQALEERQLPSRVRGDRRPGRRCRTRRMRAISRGPMWRSSARPLTRVSDRPARASPRARSARRAARRDPTSRRGSTRSRSCGSWTTATRRAARRPRADAAGDRRDGQRGLAAGAIPIVLGGDHAIAEPDVRACALGAGPVGLVHFDTHTDTGTEVFGVGESHGTPMYRLVEAGLVAPSRYVQIGLRGYWPGEEEFAWQAERGITSLFMHDVRERGIPRWWRKRSSASGRGRVPDGGHRRARPGLRAGHRHARARRDVAARAAAGVPRGGRRGRAVGADVVEVIPTMSARPTSPRWPPSGSCARC